MICNFIQISISTPSPLTTSVVSVIPVVPVIPVTPSFIPAVVSPVASALISISSVFPSPVVAPFTPSFVPVFPLGLLLFPLLLGEEILLVALDGGLVAGGALLLGSGLLGEGDLDQGQVSLLLDSDQTLFSGLVDINNLSFLDLGYLMQAGHSSLQDLGNPEGALHEPVGSLEGDEAFALAEEESKCSGHIAAWVIGQVP